MKWGIALACAAYLLTAGPGECAVRRVTSGEELEAALKAAAPGDRLALAGGSYALTGVVNVAPLTIEAADVKRPPVITPKADDTFVLDVADMPEGEVTLRGLVFDGGGKEVGALQTLGARLEVEDCAFRNFSGKEIIRSYVRKDRGALKGIRVSRCVFETNPKGTAVSSLGPALVEECTFENIRAAVSCNDWTGKWGNKPRRDYKVIIRRNRVYRTEGTDWKCHGFTTRTTAPEVYENLIHDLSKGDCSAMTIASNGLDGKGTPTAAEVYRNVIIDKWKAADSGMIHEAIEYGEYFPTKGRIYENVFVGRVRMSPALYNKGSENEWFNNTFFGVNRFFHCYGRDCRYTNNIMFGGRADGNYYARKDWDKFKDKVETATLEHSCFYKVEHIRDREFHKGEGYFEADPKFVDPDKLDFHLRFDSPCINKGVGSRDGLTLTDLGAFEYPIQVSHFKVDDKGVATWKWSNDFQKVSRLVRVRWHATRFPEVHDAKEDTTVAEVPAVLTKAPTGKRLGYFAAFVQDVEGRWSSPTPDDVHRFALTPENP